MLRSYLKLVINHMLFVPQSRRVSVVDDDVAIHEFEILQVVSRIYARVSQARFFSGYAKNLRDMITAISETI